MDMIRRREQVVDNKIIIQMPEAFSEKEVDVIIIPVRKKRRAFKSLELISLKTKGMSLNRDELHSR